MRSLLVLVLGLAAASAFAQPAEVVRNVQLFGSSVRTAATVQGDFSAAGGRVVVDQSVADDALLLGGTVDVRAPVGDDVRAAAGDISLESSVGGDVMAAGGSVKLTHAAQVAGRAELAGGDVQVDGRVDGSLSVRARRLVLNGPVGGTVQAAVETLELGPQARVGGGLRHSASTFTQHPAAVVTGAVERIDRLFDEDRRWSDRHPMHEDRWPAMAGWWLLLPVSMGLLGVLALAAVVLLVFSRFAGQAAHQIETQPLLALGVGAGFLLGLPVLAVLFFFTLLGIPLGLMVMALYPPLLLLGWLIGALYAARWLASHATPSESQGAEVPYGWMAVTVIALLVVGVVPVVGPLLVTATMAAGLGACVLEWRRRLASRPEGGP
jgi:cytoskeletal protein CcmA (bactofilin family)